MKKILIVDDSLFTRNIHKQIVESGGYETLEAANGAEALEVFQREKPDVVTMDLLMPDMDGMEVFRQMKAIDPEVKAIICSTDKQKYRQEEAAAAGATGFIPKPVEADNLLGLIGKILEGSA